MTHGTRHRPDEQQHYRQQERAAPSAGSRSLPAQRRHGAMVERASEASAGEIWRWLVGRCSGGASRFDRVARDMPSSRPPRRRRVERRQARVARRARLVALLVVLSAVFFVAIGLTAFGGTTTPTADIVSPPEPGHRRATRPATESSPSAGRCASSCRSRRAVSPRSATTPPATARSPSQPVGHQANEGLLQRVVHGIFGGGGGSPNWYQLAGGGTSALDVGAPHRHRRLLAGRRHGRRLTPFVVDGKAYGSRDRHPAAERTVARRLVTHLAADPSLAVGTTVVSGARSSARFATSPASSGRRSRATRTTRATTSPIELRAARLASASGPEL